MDGLVDKLKEKEPEILLVTLNQDYKNEGISLYLRIGGYESGYTQLAMMETLDLMSVFNIIYVRYGLKYCNL